ncbi:MAG: SDR family oxidoreductase, partial [Candidatus Andersenbacteria bacterium]|nr:SDR family oxidoreductase [Candidatus Andersenbacteria bacterium]
TARLLNAEKPAFILIDRDESRLKIVADDLKVRGASQVNTIAADLTQTEKHPTLWQQIKSYGQPDTILIAYGTLGDQKAGEKEFAVAAKEIMTNFTSTVSLLTLIANDFEAKKHGTIAVISSVAGDRGRKSNYIYGSAKGALTLFLAGLRNRLANSGVDVITIKPGFVDTPMTASLKKGLLWAQPETVARGIVRAMKKKQSIVYLPWFWRYIMFIIRSIPENIFKKMSI